MTNFDVFTVENARETRAERKARRAAERQVLQEASKVVAPERQLDGGFTTFGGKKWGRITDNGFWGPPEVKLPAHRVTSLRMGVATPFVAEAGIGHQGAIIGTDLEAGGLFCMDPWEMVRRKFITGPSFLTIGLQGTGKSTTNKALCTRLIALGRKIAIASDPKGEWVRVAEAVGGKVIEIGPGRVTRVNPLDPGQRPTGLRDKDWHGLVSQRRRRTVSTVISLLRQGRQLDEYENTALELALSDVFTRIPEGPTLVDVMNALLSPSVEVKSVLGQRQTAGEALGLALRRLTGNGDLAGMFDGPSTVSFDGEAPMIVVDTSDLLGASDEAISIAAACCSAWLDSVVRSGANEFWMIVHEEGWSSMRDPLAVRSMDERQRLAGEWGIANMLIMHELKDLDMVGEEGSSVRKQAEGLMSKAQIKIIHRQARETAPQLANVLGLTPREQDVITSLDRGVALWKIGDRSMLVQTQVTAGEFEVFNTDRRREG